MNSILGTIVVLISAIIAPQSIAKALAPLPDHSIFNSNSIWQTQTEKAVSLNSLRGTPTIIAMIYTNCPHSCPITMADLKEIEKRLSDSERKKVKFAVFSFDSDRDNLANLKGFAKKHGVDKPQWSFYQGNSSGVRELAVLLGIRLKNAAGGEFDHSNVISIVDSSGVVIHQQMGMRQNPDESIRALRKVISQSAAPSLMVTKR